MKNYEKQKLNRKLTCEDLQKFGFRNGLLRQHIYKNLIDIVLKIDLDNETWYYQIVDNDTNGLYVNYYNREYGNNELVDQLDKEVEKFFNKIRRNKILYIRRKKNGKSSKIS